MSELATETDLSPAKRLGRLYFTPDGVAVLLAELARLQGQIAALPLADDDRATSTEAPRGIGLRLREVAAEILGWSVSLLGPELMKASQQVANTYRRRGSPPKGNTWEDAEQETFLRMMVRLMDLAEGPVDDFDAYAFVMMRNLLTGWQRRASSEQPGSGYALDTLPTKRDQTDQDTLSVHEEFSVRLAQTTTPVGGLPLDRVYQAVVRHDFSISKAAEELGISEPKLRKLWAAARSWLRMTAKPSD